MLCTRYSLKKFKCSRYFLVSTTLRQALIWSAFCKWRSQVSNPGGHLTPKAHALHQKTVTTVGPENDPEGARPSQQTGWGLPFSSSISLHPMEPPLSALRGKFGLLGAPNPAGVAKATLNGSGQRRDHSRVLSSFALGAEPNLCFVTDLHYPEVSFGYLLWELGRLGKYSAGQPEN